MATVKGGNAAGPASVGVDQVGGADVQLVKLTFGDSASATRVEAAAPLPVTVPGAVAVTGTFWPVTQPVSVASALPVNDDGASLTVDAPVGTPVHVRLSNGATAVDTIPVGDGGGSLTVDGTVAVTGTFWQSTQPVSGTVTANAGSGPFPVSDNAGSLTVDAPVATPVFVRLSDGASAISALPVTDNSGSLTVDGATTSYLAQKRISVTPTISTSIYASGDAVGGLMTFSNAARVSGGSITIQSVVIIDNDQELAPLELVLFDRTFTATTDNAAFDPTDADLANCIGVVKVSDYASFNDNSVATRAGIGLAATLNGTDLFGQLVVRSAPTYTATNDIIVIVQVVQD